MKNHMVRGKKCEICGIKIMEDGVYCRKCWVVVNAIMLDQERFLLVLSKLRNCKICARTCKDWQQDV